MTPNPHFSIKRPFILVLPVVIVILLAVLIPPTPAFAADIDSQKMRVVTSDTCTATKSGTWTEVFSACPGASKYVIPSGYSVSLDNDLNLAGDLELAGGTFDPATYTVTLTSDTTQTLTGTPITFYNLILNKTYTSNTVTVAGSLVVDRMLTITQGKLLSASDYVDIVIQDAGTLELTNDITVSGNFTKTIDGTYTPNSHSITFDGGTEQTLYLESTTDLYSLVVVTGTTLIETNTNDNAYASDAITNHGTLRKTQPVNMTNQYYFGLAGKFNGADLEINVSDLTGDNPLTAIQVDQVAGNHAGRTGSAGHGVGWGRYWRITPTGSDFIASVTLPHDIATQDDAKACRHVSGTTWDCRQDAVSAITVKYSDTTGFSDWAVGDTVKPSSITMQRASAGSLPAAWAVWVGFGLGGIIVGAGWKLTRRRKAR